MAQVDAVVSLVVYAKDRDAVACFYAAELGLEAVDQSAEDDDFVILAGPGVELTVVRIPESIAAGIAIASPPEVREDTPFKPSFLVPSLAAARAAALSAGGRLQPEASEWRFRGYVQVDGLDPEGNVVQFRQLETASDPD